MPLGEHSGSPDIGVGDTGSSRTEVARSLAAITAGSRLLVWSAAFLAATAFGVIRTPGGLALPGLTLADGRLSDRLVAWSARWDASWYLVIAGHGYLSGPAPVGQRPAFFPLYPLLIRALSEIGLPLIAGGVVISVLSLGGALMGMYRLAVLDGDRASARPRDAALLGALALAICPMAVFFSAVYSDSLYLMLSVGAFLYARRERWAIAGVLGGLAAATRFTGVLLVVPLLAMYLYGPRCTPPPDVQGRSGLRPRYRLSRDVAWIALVPAGMLAFMGYLATQGLDPLAPFHAEQLWGHRFVGPLQGLWLAAQSAFHDLRALLDGHAHLSFLSSDPSTSIDTGWQNLMPFLALLLSIPALVGVARTLPAAYFLYAFLALVLVLSDPVQSRPLQSVPRYEAGLFPLFMWLGIWLERHRRWRLPVLGGSALLAVLFAAEFATWHFVA